MNVVVVLSTMPGLNVYQWKRSNDVQWYVHIPHAATELAAYPMFGLDYYDAVMMLDEYQMRDIRNLENMKSFLRKELVMTGIPYMDKMAARRVASCKLNGDNCTVLLAP